VILLRGGELVENRSWFHRFSRNEKVEERRLDTGRVDLDPDCGLTHRGALAYRFKLKSR
jgi:hypothetical protein